MTAYVVRYWWKGSYWSGWSESSPFDTIEEANRFVSRLKSDGPWKILRRQETTVTSNMEVEHGKDD